MGYRLRFAAAVAFCLSVQCAAQTPVAKVIQMLTDMDAKGKKEMAEEKEVYEKYAKFVRLQTKELTHEITTSKAQIEELIAAIEKHESDIQQLSTSINKLEGEVDTLEADMKAATAIRDTEHSEFLEQQTSYTESLYALDRAIQMLKAQDYDRAQATALLQKSAKTMPGMRRVLAALALVQVQEATAGDGAPAVAAYEFQSGAVVEMLVNLQKKFTEELGNLEKEEMNQQQAYDMAQVHNGNTVSNMKKEMQNHIASRARITSESAAAKDTLSDTKASLAEAEKFLAEMEATFKSKTATFEANQKLRAEELEVLAKAIEIISSPDVAGNYGKVVKSFVQLPAPSFLQMRAASAARIGTRGAAANFLAQRAQALHSKTLASFAAQLAANPFAKVIDMISELLARLKQEAADEADHKAFCDEELKKNKQTRKDKESESSRLMAEIEEKAKEIKEMGEEITVLAEEQAELRKSMKEATEVRATEKKENEAAIADAQAAQVAMKQAMAVLQEFYGSEALIQMTKAQQVPEMEAYKGMKTRGGGVMGMLEVIDSDFARVEAETEAAEVQAAEQYKSFMKEAEADVEAKHEAEFKLSLKKDKTEFAQEQLQKDLDAAQAQLKAANQYYEELKPQCVEVHVSYEERAAMRQEEIAALQQAYKILDAK